QRGNAQPVANGRTTVDGGHRLGIVATRGGRCQSHPRGNCAGADIRHRERREEKREKDEAMTRSRRLHCFLFCLASVLSVLSVVNCLRAQTSYPMITHTLPAAVQRGKTTEVTVEGQMNFSGVYKALFEGTGISAEVVANGRPAPPARQKSLP